ncbi:MBL fold metallo-hydrolase [Qipengyuania sp.]|uniref:MBL fold metallo-hydrolase n=1 Tax=Qipengyuania sp. TaxID=2004515 RepID=UPI003BABC6DC
MAEEAFRIGSFKVYRIEEWQGGFSPPEDLFAEFEPDAFSQRASGFEPDFMRDGMLYAYLQSWLIDTGEERILIDTGAGNAKERPGIPVFGNLDGDFLEKLGEAGFAPDDIDKVFCTHLHIDHVGWNTRLVGDRWEATFPNATYFLPRLDEEAWNPQKDRFSSMTGAVVNSNVFEDSVAPIIEAGLAELVNDGASIANGMSAHYSPGHTPGHMVLEVTYGGQIALFTGDILHHPMQVYRPDWNNVYCESRPQAASTRRRILEQAASTGARIVPAHFGAPHFVFVERASEGFRPVFPDQIAE